MDISSSARLACSSFSLTRDAGDADSSRALSQCAFRHLLVSMRWAVRHGPSGMPGAMHRIENPSMPPESQAYEGDGVNGDSFRVRCKPITADKIPSKFFMQSQACQRCHPDIYEQWNSSAHHFSSFNNQWYRKSIEYMQDVIGVQPSKWCAGCHDPALLFSGKFDTPVREIDRHAGSPGRTRMRHVPFRVAGEKHDGTGRFHARISGAGTSLPRARTNSCVRCTIFWCM